jgi:hypothetical protein
MTDSSTIIVLGGPSAGKTVYLSVLYHHLWNGCDGMVMRAGSGAMHAELLSSVDALKRGVMPPATQALRPYEFELEHSRRKYHLRCLDYPGELYRRVFFDLAIDTDESRELMRFCEDAAGVIVLADPASIVANPAEMDYCLSNLFRFYQSRPVMPKFVFALTKRDENSELVGTHVAQFVMRHLPHSARLLGPGMRLMHFSSLAKAHTQVQLANAAVVKAPVEAMLQAIEQEQVDRARQAVLRRASARDALIKAGWFLALFVAVLLAFLAGIYVRYVFELHRGATMSPGTGG